MNALLSCVTRRMEQHSAEIGPFIDWVLETVGFPSNVVEIGVRWGGTAQLWCEMATRRVVGVDWGLADSLGLQETIDLAAGIIAEYPSLYRFVLGDSHLDLTVDKVVRHLAGTPVDLLFLDGDHSYVGIARDFELYSPLVRSGGIIAFHDIVDSPFIRSVGHGVYRFWQELSGNKREFCIGADWGGIGALVMP